MQNLIASITAFFKRLSVSEYVTAYLVFGMLLSAAGIIVFADIAGDVMEGDEIVAFDMALAEALHAQATPNGTSVYLAISWLGGAGLWAVGATVGLYYLLRRQWTPLFVWGIAVIGGGVLNALMKNLFVRPRPYFAVPLAVEQSYSFPSGHAMASLVIYGLFAYLLWHQVRSRSARLFIFFVTANLIVWIGISRMTLGVHYFSDVMAGYAGGGLWLGVCVAVLNILERRGAILARRDTER